LDGAWLDMISPPFRAGEYNRGTMDGGFGGIVIQIFLPSWKKPDNKPSIVPNGSLFQRPIIKLFTGSQPDVWISISAFDYGR